MRFVCESCRAQYMINDEKVGPKGVKVRCRKCGYVILVKRADGKGGGPVSMSNDPDDALATQVMQTPLAPAEATLSNEDTHAAEDMTSPGTSGPTLSDGATNGSSGGAKDSFFGADEDEIGAVFDQVLKGGGPKDESNGESVGAGSNDDRQSTRVIDADTVRKLAEESGVIERPSAAIETPKPEEVPQTDWYVALNEKQTGPLTLDKIKEHWDKGEVGPDSLCWRAGFDDWIPVSEAKMLAGVLAPKPPKPIVVAPAATITQSTPALVSVPVQSAFSSGGMMQTVQSEMQVPMSATAASSIADREESGTWKPSGASALANLVKDEMDALAKPPPKPIVVEEPPARGGGLLDLPAQDERPTSNAAVALPSAIEERAPRPPPQAPVNPYLANPGATFSAPAVTQYRPPSNRNLMIGIAAGGGVMLLILVGLVVWLATRDQKVIVQQPVAVVQPPVAPQQPVAVAQPPANPAPTNVPPANTAPANPPPANTAPANPPPANPTNTAPANPVANTPPVAAPVAAPVAPVQPKGNPTRKTSTNTTREDPPEPKEVKKAPAAPAGDGDDFDKAFGNGNASKSAPKEEPKPEKKQPGYIPPAPGSSDVKESLAQSDIMEVVIANKGALAACTAKKEAGTSGKLVMEWTIATSGKVAKVGLASGSEDFKGTPMAACFSAAIKAMSFPKHKVAGEPVKFPFKF